MTRPTGSLDRLADVALFGLLGFEIRKKWRSVAVLGLIVQMRLIRKDEVAGLGRVCQVVEKSTRPAGVLM